MSLLETLAQVTGFLSCFVFPVCFIVIFVASRLEKRVEQKELQVGMPEQSGGMDTLPPWLEMLQGSTENTEPEKPTPPTPFPPPFNPYPQPNPVEKVEEPPPPPSSKRQTHNFESLLESLILREDSDFYVKLKLPKSERLRLFGKKWIISDAEIELGKRSKPQPREEETEEVVEETVEEEEEHPKESLVIEEVNNEEPWQLKKQKKKEENKIDWEIET